MADPVSKPEGIRNTAKVQNLIKVLEEEDPFSETAAQAFRELGKIGPAAKEAVPAVMESAFLIGHPFAKARKYVSSHWSLEYPLFGDPWERTNFNLRQQAKVTLLNIGKEALEEAIPELLKGMATGDEERRFFCAYFLAHLDGKIGEEYQRILSYAAPDIVPKLIEDMETLTGKAMNPNDFSIYKFRYEDDLSTYANALAQFGEAAVPYLIDALPADSEKDSFGMAFVDSLAKIGAPAVPHLAEVFRSEEGNRMVLAFEALFKMGPAAREATLEFARCVNPQLPDPYCQRKIGVTPIDLVAEGTLRKIGIGALPYVLPLLDDPDPSVRSAAMQAYGFFVSWEENPQLQQDFILTMIEKLEDPDARIVAGAVFLLGHYAPGNGIAHFALPLLYAIKSDPGREEHMRNLARETADAIEEKAL